MTTLANKTIYIGRHREDNRLHILVISNDKKEARAVRFGEPGSVNRSVSRLETEGNVTAHCKIEIDNKENMRIENLKETNVTWVDGDMIQKRGIDENSMLELGKGHYAISVNTILKITKKALGIVDDPPVGKDDNGNNSGGNGSQSSGSNHNTPEKCVSISHLEKVWNDYDKGVWELKKKQKHTQTVRMLIMAGGSLIGSVLGFYLSDLGLIISALPSLLICGFILFLSVFDKSIDESKEIEEKFQDEYVCPVCKKHLGRTAFRNLLREHPCCPRGQCRTKFTL